MAGNRAGWWVECCINANVQLILALAVHLCNTASMETNKTCPVCGEPVPPSRGSRARVYCSNKCNIRAWREANPEKVKEQNRAWREANPEKVKERNRAKVENLSDAYVAKILRMKVSEVPQHLIELKREQLIYHRCTRQLTEALKEKKDDQ